MDGLLGFIAKAVSTIVGAAFLYAVVYNVGYFQYLQWRCFDLLDLSDFLTSAVTKSSFYWVLISLVILVYSVVAFIASRAPKKTREEKLDDDDDSTFGRYAILVAEIVIAIVMFIFAYRTAIALLNRDIAKGVPYYHIIALIISTFIAINGLAAQKISNSEPSKNGWFAMRYMMFWLYGAFLYFIPMVSGSYAAFSDVRRVSAAGVACEVGAQIVADACVIRLLDKGALVASRAQNSLTFLTGGSGISVQYRYDFAAPAGKWKDIPAYAAIDGLLTQPQASGADFWRWIVHIRQSFG